MNVATRYYAVNIATAEPNTRIQVLEQIADDEIKLADGLELNHYVCICGTSPSRCSKWIDPRDIVSVE